MAAAAAALVFAACSMGDAGALIRPPASDAGFGGVGDAASPRADATTTPMPPDAGPGATLGRGEAPGTFAADACFDGVDDDGDLAIDCADTTCQSNIGACCVGRGVAGCCAVPALDPLIDFETCTSDPRSCLTMGDVAFASSVAMGRLVLTGDGVSDTGVWLSKPHDLATARLSIGATIGLPACATCTGFAAVGVTTQDFSASVASNVRPVVALVASASLGELRVLIGDEVAWRQPLAFGTAGGVVSYELSLDPEGVVSVRDTTGGMPTVVGRFVPVRDAHVVIYGRGRNPSGGVAPVEVDDVSVAESLCDIPSGWRSRAHVLPEMEGSPTEDYVGPGAAVGGDGKLYLAYAHAGTIAIAEESTAADVTRRILGTTTPALLNPASGERYADPELVRDAAGVWYLYATRVSIAAGTSDIVRVTGVAGDEPTFAAGVTAEVVIPSGSLGAGTIAEPAVAYDASASRPWRMWLHAASTDGAHSIIELDSMNGAAWSPVRAGPDASEVVPLASAIGALEVDEVAAPTIVRHGTTWQLYFAGRRGARWSIHMTASDDLVLWTAPVVSLGASGAGFDSLSVRDPSVVARGGDVELYYVGSDGALSQIGRAVRSATSSRAGAGGGT